MFNFDTRTKTLVGFAIISFMLCISGISFWQEQPVYAALPWVIIIVLGVGLISAKLHEAATHVPHRHKHLYSITLYPNNERATIFIKGYDGITDIQIRGKQVIICGDSSDYVYNNVPYREFYRIPASNERSLVPRTIFISKIENEFITFMMAWDIDIEKLEVGLKYMGPHYQLDDVDIPMLLRQFYRRHDVYYAFNGEIFFVPGGIDTLNL